MRFYTYKPKFSTIYFKYLTTILYIIEFISGGPKKGWTVSGKYFFPTKETEQRLGESANKNT